MNRSPALIIVGNGPGEVVGWAIPIAREARRCADRDRLPLEISLCLPPCQFASGQERAVAEAAGVFDRVVEPAMTLRLGLGLNGWTPAAAPTLLHVGGDFWYTRRLARRWRARAFAFVERAHIARSHRAFTRIFVASDYLRDRLERRGVPSDKVAVTGDPRHDAVVQQHQDALSAVAAASRNGNRRKVTLLAGSRDTVFNAFFPFWVETAAALRSRLPNADLTIVVSPFVSPACQGEAVGRHAQALTEARISVVRGSAAEVAGSDLVLTIPGTNTLEMAILRIPSIVVMPFSLAPRIPLEGIVEWITRVPFAGPALRLFLAREYVKRQPHGVSLPNMRAGRRIMPEMVGQITPEQVADEGARIVRDEHAMASMARALEAITLETGASGRILHAMGLACHAA
jgi:lipid-A-disaccharide synthase